MGVTAIQDSTFDWREVGAQVRFCATHLRGNPVHLRTRHCTGVLRQGTRCRSVAADSKKGDCSDASIGRLTGINQFAPLRVPDNPMVVPSAYIDLEDGMMRKSRVAARSERYKPLGNPNVKLA